MKGNLGILICALLVINGIPSTGWAKPLDKDNHSLELGEKTRPIAVYQWRWGGGSNRRISRPSPSTLSSLFESDKTWGWKEWTIIGGSVGAIAAIVLVATSGSHGGGGGGGGGY